MSPRLLDADPSSAPAALLAAAVDGTRAQSGKKRKRDGENGPRASDEDDAFDPEDDSDLGLGAEEDDERIGLDTSTGFEEAPDDLDLPEREEDEDERWSVDSEEAGDLADADSDLFPGEEYGWIGDDEPSADSDDEDAFDDLDDEDGEFSDDGGAEGVEDDSDLDDLDLDELPELDADSEEDASSNVEGFDELGGLALIDEPSLEISAGELWKMLPSRATRITRLAAPASPLTTMLAHGRTLYVAAASGLFRLAHDATELSALPLPAAGAASSLALAELEGDQHLAVVASGRVYLSQDGGQHFDERPVSGLARAFYTRSASGLRLWWRTTRAELGSDRGQGSLLPAELDGEVQSFHADGKRSLALVVKREGRLQLVASGDAGKRFQRHALPPAAAGSGTRQIEVQVCRDAVLVNSDQAPRCAVLPGPFEPIATLARAPAVLSDEEDEAFVYACVARGEEWLVIRRAAAARSSAPLVIATFGKDSLAEPRALAVGYREGGALCVFVAGNEALLRIEASLDGEELA